MSDDIISLFDCSSSHLNSNDSREVERTHNERREEFDIGSYEFCLCGLMVNKLKMDTLLVSSRTTRVNNCCIVNYIKYIVFVENSNVNFL